MAGSSAEIEALPGSPTPGSRPAIVRDIVGRLDAAGLADAVVGRIARRCVSGPASCAKPRSS